jgi:hypothetical protein
MNEDIKPLPCPFCGEILTFQIDEMGGVWYEHSDRNPYTVFTYKTNYNEAKRCVLSHFTLDGDPKAIKQWNDRIKD